MDGFGEVFASKPCGLRPLVLLSSLFIMGCASGVPEGGKSASIPAQQATSSSAARNEISALPALTAPSQEYTATPDATERPMAKSTGVYRSIEEGISTDAEQALAEYRASEETIWLNDEPTSLEAPSTERQPAPSAAKGQITSKWISHDELPALTAPHAEPEPVKAAKPDWAQLDESLTAPSEEPELHIVPSPDASEIVNAAEPIRLPPQEDTVAQDVADALAGSEPSGAVIAAQHTVEKAIDEATNELQAADQEELEEIQVISDGAVAAYLDLSLDDAIRLALQHSTVLRDVGGRLIQAPALTPTIYDPAIQATDPRFGVEGALSEFDAQFTTSAFFEKNDRVLNNELLGGGVNLFRQDMARVQAELSKKSATGTELAVRHNVIDDANNATQNIFERAYDWNLETELRHPILQGGGTLFNRIAGRSESPGVANGVMIAQVNSRISAAEFQLAMRDFVSNVENAYWDLVFAYRDLEAKKSARDRTLNTWRMLENLKNEGIVEQDKVEQALEQYYRFKEEVENAYYGRLAEGTKAFNGSGGGTFQAPAGIHVAERRLRLVMGLPVNTMTLLRPVTEPPAGEMIHDTDEAVARAVASRGELRIQQMRIDRHNLELIANRNYLLPELDFVARYRWRGLGDNLYDPVVPPEANDNLTGNIRSNRHEWLVGAEFSYPLGFRQGHAAVRNSQLRLAQDRAVMREMQRQISHDVGNALSNVDRSYRVLKAAFNRRVSAQRRYTFLANEELQAARKVDFNLLLDADRRLAESESSYHRACVDYALAIKNLNFEMGALLDYCNVHLASDVNVQPLAVKSDLDYTIVP